MANGLDIGTGALRSASGDREDPTIRGEPPVVLPVEEGELVDADVSPERVRTVESGGTTYVVGSDAKRVAAALGAEPVGLLSRGVLTVDEFAEPALGALVTALLDDGDGTRLCYTTPGPLVDGDEATAAHREALESIVEGLGYETTPVSKGFAVVYDQLGGDNYTGLGVCIEREVTCVSLAYYGVPVMAFSLGKGSDWIVERAADSIGEDPAKLASELDEFTLDPDADAGGVESALARAYDALAEELVRAIGSQADESALERGIAVPVAVAGERAVAGVEFLFGGRFDAADLPFSIRGVRLATEPAESAVRGALTAAVEDVDAYEEVTWSELTAHGADESGDSGPGTDGPGSSTRVSFDDRRHDAGGDGSDADAAIDKLFDRLANRDDEVESVVTDVQTLSESLDRLEDRAAPRETVEAVEERLEVVHDELAALEEATSTHADAAAVEAIETELTAIDDTVDAVETALDELAALAERLDRKNEDAADHRATIAADVETLDGDVDALDGDVDALYDDVDALDEDVESVASAVETVEVEVRTLEETLEADIRAVEESVEVAVERYETSVEDAVESVEDQLDAELENLGSDVSGLTERVSSVENRTDELSDLIDTVADAGVSDEEYEAILDRVASVEALVDELADDAATVRDRVAEVDDEVADLDDGIADLDDRVAEGLTDAIDRTAALETSVEELESTVDAVESTVETRIDDVDERVANETDALDEELTEVRAGIEAFDERIDGIEDRSDEFEEAVEDRLSALETAIADVETPTSGGGGDRAVAATLYDQQARIEAVVEQVEEQCASTAAVSRLADRIGSLEREFETSADELDARIESASEQLDDYVSEREEDTHGQTGESARVDAERSANSFGALAPSLLAGGGSAGVVAGSVFAVSGDTLVGAAAVFVGVALAAGAIFAADR